jgi:hypothetical protein
MTDADGTRDGAEEKEAEMREHEREAREREAAERSPEDPDEDAGKPAPPGSANIGGGVSGGT